MPKFIRVFEIYLDWGSGVARIQVEPVTFWLGLAMMIVGVIVYPSPYLNIYLTSSLYLMAGALLSWVGVFLLVLSYAIGTSRRLHPVTAGQSRAE